MKGEDLFAPLGAAGLALEQQTEDVAVGNVAGKTAPGFEDAGLGGFVGPFDLKLVVDQIGGMVEPLDGQLQSAAIVGTANCGSRLIILGGIWRWRAAGEGAEALGNLRHTHPLAFQRGDLGQALQHIFRKISEPPRRIIWTVRISHLGSLDQTPGDIIIQGRPGNSSFFNDFPTG
jgi:hypothetical protein